MKTASQKIAISIIVMTFTALACGPLDLAQDILEAMARGTPTATATATSFAFTEVSVWYVATDGSDSNGCDTPAAACLTVVEALARADADDEIYIAAGTYNEIPGVTRTSGNALVIDFNLSIRGDGAASTLLDGSGIYGLFDIRGDAEVRIRDLTLQNAGHATGYCLGIGGDAAVLLEDVFVQDCIGTGINSSSRDVVQLTNVIVTRTLGSGVSGTNFDVQGGEIRENDRGGISANGDLILNGTRVAANGTSGVVANGTASMSAISVLDNNASGILIGGTADLNNVTVNGNGSGPPSFNHPAMVITGDATVTDSSISNNEEGIAVRQDGTLTMISSSINGSQRIGLSASSNANANLLESTISDNGIFYAGTSLPAGIAVADNSRVELSNSEVSNNHNGGVEVSGSGEVAVIDSTISGNEGEKPAFLINGTDANGLLERSLVDDNNSGDQAVANNGTLTMLNTTVSGNTGAGVVGLNGSLGISYSTIADNSGIGLVAGAGRDVFSTIANVLVARNGDRDCSFSVGSAGTSPPLAGENMATDDSCGFPEVYTPAELRLDGLADNGGPTQTHALLPESPAIDAAAGSCPDTDQRNAPRPIGPGCDVGAYEAGGVPLLLADSGILIATPTLIGDQPSTVTVKRDTPCYGGPGPGYLFYRTLREGETLLLVGAGFTGGGNADWIVASHPDLANINCWLKGDDGTASIPTSDMRLITVPAPLTATPTLAPGDPRQPDGQDDPGGPPDTPCPPIILCP